MVERQQVDNELSKLSQLASQGLTALEHNPGAKREDYEKASKAFQDEIRTLEKSPDLLKQVAARASELHNSVLDQMAFVLDKDGNVTRIDAKDAGDHVEVSAVVLPPKQRELVDKLEDALAKNDRTQAGAMARDLQREVVRSFETNGVDTIGNLDQPTDARRKRLAEITHSRVNPDLLQRGSQEMISYMQPDMFMTSGGPYFAEVGNRQTKKFEYMIRKDGSIPWNLPMAGPYYGGSEEPGRP